MSNKNKKDKQKYFLSGFSYELIAEVSDDKFITAASSADKLFKGLLGSVIKNSNHYQTDIFYDYTTLQQKAEIWDRHPPLEFNVEIPIMLVSVDNCGTKNRTSFDNLPFVKEGVEAFLYTFEESVPLPGDYLGEPKSIIRVYHGGIEYAKVP